MPEIPRELNSNKARFSEMMYRLARMYRTPDGELTAEFQQLYWEQLQGYPIELLIKGMDNLLGSHDDKWFPLITEIKKAAQREADRSATKRLPIPDEKASPEQLRNNRYNLEWWILYFHVPKMKSKGKQGYAKIALRVKTDSQRPIYKTPPDLTAGELKRFTPFLQVDGDTEHDANRKRRGYVKLRKQMDGIE